MGFHMMDSRITSRLFYKGQVQDAPHSRPGPLVGGASRKSCVLSYTGNLLLVFEENVKRECVFRDSW